MTPEQRMAAELNATAGVTALVGSRITPLYRKQGSPLPAVVYEVISDEPLNWAGGTTGNSQMNLRIYCMAASYLGAKELGAAVQTVLSGWNDDEGRVWHLLSQNDDVGDPIPGQDVPEFYAIDQSYTVWHEVAA